MYIDNDGYKFIESPEDLNSIKSREPFKYKCISCGNIASFKSGSYKPHMKTRLSNMLCPKCGSKQTCLNKYGVEHPSQNKDIHDKTVKTINEKYGVSNVFQNELIKEIAKKTKLERYGDENYNNRDKCKETSIKNYGTENPVQSQIVKDKIANTNRERYGCDSYMKSSDFRNKSKATMNEKYDVDYAQQSEEVRNKSKSVRLERYGDENYNNRDKAKQTSIVVYGVENPMQNEEIKAKSRITCVERYGVENPAQSKEIQAKMAATCIERYGNQYYFGSKSFVDVMSYLRSISPDKFGSKKMMYLNGSFDSITEFCIYIYCIYHWIPIHRCIKYVKYVDKLGKSHKAYPDFVIAGNTVEIKGGLYYNTDGVTWESPYKKKKVDGEWIPMTPEEYEYQSSIYESKRQCLLANNVIILRDNHPWVQMCVNWVKTFFGNFFIWQYTKNTFENVSYGYNPYNCDQTKEFQEPIGLGLTPFDVSALNK